MPAITINKPNMLLKAVYAGTEFFGDSLFTGATFIALPVLRNC
jgi:hypothetical protein